MFQVADFHALETAGVVGAARCECRAVGQRRHIQAFRAGSSVAKPDKTLADASSWPERLQRLFALLSPKSPRRVPARRLALLPYYAASSESNVPSLCRDPAPTRGTSRAQTARRGPNPDEASASLRSKVLVVFGVPRRPIIKTLRPSPEAAVGPSRGGYGRGIR